jgi:transcriptional regulator with XRE-family HTH domain
MSPEQELEALADWPELAVCRILASKVRAARVAAGETQAQFAERAGIPLRTYKRFELSGAATLENFIQVLRTLGRTRYLAQLFASALPPRPPTALEKAEALRGRAMLETLRREG